MRTAYFSGRFVSVVAALVFAPAGLCDAPCNKGYRDTTPAERARITAALQAAKDALPPAPEGWQLRGDDQFSVPASLCQDGEKLPWDYGFTRSYGQVGDYEERQKIMEDAAAASAATQAKNQARMDALQAQMMAIMQQQMALNQKGDYDGAQKLQPQFEKAQTEYEKFVAASNAQVDAAGKEFNRDLEMSIAVRVNADSVRPGNGATPLAKPPGALTAVRWQPEDPDITNDEAVYLFGYWKQGPDGIWRSGTRAGVPTSAPHAISVHVNADRERLAETVQAIDFGKIAAILR